VHPRAEAEVPVWFSADIKARCLGEHVTVPARRGIAQTDGLACADQNITDHRVAAGVAATRARTHGDGRRGRASTFCPGSSQFPFQPPLRTCPNRASDRQKLATARPVLTAVSAPASPCVRSPRSIHSCLQPNPATVGEIGKCLVDGLPRRADQPSPTEAPPQLIDTTPSRQSPQPQLHSHSRRARIRRFPATPDLLRTSCAVPAKATALQNIPACSPVSLKRTRHQSACDGFECPDWIRRQGCVVSVVCGGGVVPSIA
jgi:hypothetical protein